VGKKGEGPKQVVARINGLVKLILAQPEAKGVFRVGVGVAGQLDSDKLAVKSAPNLAGFDGLQLAKILERSLKLKVTLENDARCFTLAEATLGSARKYDRVLGVTLGTGVGGGLCVDGQIQDGSHLCAGEIGHTLVVYGGEKCSCGSKGCLEQYASGTAICRMARKMLGKNIPASALATAARKGQMGPKKVYSIMGSYLGSGLASAVNLLDPQVIVLGGSVSNSIDLFGPSMHKAFNQGALPPLKKVPIIRASLQDAGVVGSALSAMQ
jgi:glucokinase